MHHLTSANRPGKQSQPLPSSGPRSTHPRTSRRFAETRDRSRSWANGWPIGKLSSLHKADLSGKRTTSQASGSQARMALGYTEQFLSLALQVSARRLLRTSKPSNRATHLSNSTQVTRAARSSLRMRPTLTTRRSTATSLGRESCPRRSRASMTSALALVLSWTRSTACRLVTVAVSEP